MADTHKYYTVKSGDTLSKIAKKHEITVDQLYKLNPKLPKDARKLHIGTVIDTELVGKKLRISEGIITVTKMVCVPDKTYICPNTGVLLKKVEGYTINKIKVKTNLEGIGKILVKDNLYPKYICPADATFVAKRLPQSLGLPKDHTSPFDVGVEWLTGNGPRERTFKSGDDFTELLKKHEHIENIRQKIAKDVKKALKTNQVSMTALSDTTGNSSYSLGGKKGVGLYIKDYSTLLTGGLTGNLAVTYLGSYKLAYKIVDLNINKHIVSVEFKVTNSSTINSATHPPVIGYTKFWEDNIGKKLNEKFKTGPLSKTTQTLTWTEQIKF